ncbi:ERV/ALR sulfhydryl oxidase domain-containing protein [Leptodontidium sp. 2 PMI_412]|nr:ERV/ALR sulfhydryl oxidase domain-containing protein [Leptodontidium sp. 2 PMI_412]
MPRRQHITLLMILGVSAFLGIFFISFFRGIPEGGRSADFLPSYAEPLSGHVDEGLLHTEAKAPKLENATLKAELGHAAWKVLHTMMAKFPDKPTEDDSAALKSYIHLFARLYPCGDCARHFQKILKKYPPQVATRSTAAAWACHVHNEVNKRLKKEIFDCSNIGDFYDCGCAEDKPEKGKGSFTQLELEKEGLTRGG